MRHVKIFLLGLVIAATVFTNNVAGQVNSKGQPCKTRIKGGSQCGGRPAPSNAVAQDKKWDNYCCEKGFTCRKAKPMLWTCVPLSDANAPAPRKPRNDEGKPDSKPGVKKWFVGANIPWNTYGADFGTHPSWGSLYNPNAFEKIFSDMEGIAEVARLFVFTDGRAEPKYDTNDRGRPLAVDAKFWADLDDMLGRAAKHNVKVMLNLWDFHMMHDTVSAANGGMRGSMFTNDENLDLYLQLVLRPLARRYANHKGVWGFDIINEPEWAIPEADVKTDQAVPLRNMQRFVAKSAIALHEEAPEKLVTVGQASMKWMCTDSNKGCAGNLFTDEALQASVGGHVLAYLDIWQVHYYDWMYQTYDPYLRPRDYFVNPGKVTFIGETYAKGGKYDIATQIKLACQNGYGGIMFWAYQQGENFGEWASMKDALASAKCSGSAS